MTDEEILKYAKIFSNAKGDTYKINFVSEDRTIDEVEIWEGCLLLIDELKKEVASKDWLIDKLQKENKESKELYDRLFNGYNKLVQEHLELEKTIDLIIDDFQMENYFVGMTNKEVREYYKKRKELKE